MNPPVSTTRTTVLLSFSSAYAELARRVAGALQDANIDVRYDQWFGGGGVPATRALSPDMRVGFVLPLLTPSDGTATWIGSEWKEAVYDQARAQSLAVLPLRGFGDDSDVVPDFLRDLSYADLRERDYEAELGRLVETIRDSAGDPTIQVPVIKKTAIEPLGLSPDPLALELGDKLGAVIEAGKRRFLDDEGPMLYDGLFYELGVRVPRLKLRVGSDLPPWTARVLIHDVPEYEAQIPPGMVLVNDRLSDLQQRGFDGEAAINPATGADCTWISAHAATAASQMGLTTWDEQQFLILTLSAVLRRRAADLIGIDEAQAMLEQLRQVFPYLVSETVPRTVSLFVFTDVLRRLVVELVSIRDLRRILMALADWGRIETDPLMLTEYARASLRRYLTHQLSRGTRQLTVLLLDPEIERFVQASIKHTATGSYSDLKRDEVRKILAAIHQPFDRIPNDAQVPQILTTMEIRSSVRRLVATSLPRLHVLSYQELADDVDVQPLGRIALDGFQPRPGVMFDGKPLWE